MLSVWDCCPPPPSQCWHIDKDCDYCHKKGHLARVCKQRLKDLEEEAKAKGKGKGKGKGENQGKDPRSYTEVVKGGGKKSGKGRGAGTGTGPTLNPNTVTPMVVYCSNKLCRQPSQIGTTHRPTCSWRTLRPAKEVPASNDDEAKEDEEETGTEEVQGHVWGYMMDGEDNDCPMEDAETGEHYPEEQWQEDQDEEKDPEVAKLNRAKEMLESMKWDQCDEDIVTLQQQKITALEKKIKDRPRKTDLDRKQNLIRLERRFLAEQAQTEHNIEVARQDLEREKDNLDREYQRLADEHDNNMRNAKAQFGALMEEARKREQQHLNTLMTRKEKYEEDKEKIEKEMEREEEEAVTKKVNTGGYVYHGKGTQKEKEQAEDLMEGLKPLPQVQRLPQEKREEVLRMMGMVAKLMKNERPDPLPPPAAAQAIPAQTNPLNVPSPTQSVADMAEWAAAPTFAAPSLGNVPNRTGVGQIDPDQHLFQDTQDEEERIEEVCASLQTEEKEKKEEKEKPAKKKEDIAAGATKKTIGSIGKNKSARQTAGDEDEV